MSDRGFGNPLGNPLVAKVSSTFATALLNDPVIVDFNSTSGLSGTFSIPTGYKFFRVTAVGAGGSGNLSLGSSGGGLSQTKILEIKSSVSIDYIAAPQTTGNQVTGASSSAVFLGYSLLATGGAPTAGGVGSGGDFNFTGGVRGTVSAGGGAAGPRGDGGRGADTVSTKGSDSYTGGGGGSAGSSSYSGGGGVGAPGGAVVSGQSGTGQATSNTYWGGAANGVNGGNWGGGAGVGTGAIGGAGGVRIELW